MTSTDLATTGDDFYTGLEDLDASDLKMPRLNIDHKEGVFVDSLSNAQFSELSIIALAVVKGRVLWKPNITEEASVPLCKSVNFKVGYPTTTQAKSVDNFPWGATGWKPTDFEPDSDGRTVLPCDSCALKEWGSHPVDGSKTWCTEQHNIPILYAPVGEEPSMLALFTTQRSSIQASKGYFSGISRQNLPAFAFYAKMTLSRRERGKNVFYVPIIAQQGRTPSEMHADYATTSRSVKAFLQRTPVMRDEDGKIVGGGTIDTVMESRPAESTSWAPAASTPAKTTEFVPVATPVTTAAASPVVTGSVVPSAEDDDLPF